MESPDELRQLEAARRRLESMGLAWREAPGGRSLLVRLPMRDEPLPAPAGPLPVPQVVFATVGANRIKCLVPRPLFHLPLISIADCAGAEAVEGRIREAWRERQAELAGLRAWLEKLGSAPEPPRPEPVLEVPLGLEDPEARARALGRDALVLPGRGPLSGIALRRAEDRLFRPDPALDSRMDLELAVASRLEELARLEERLARRERLRGREPEPVRVLPHRRRGHRVLMVGREVAGERALREALRVHGCSIATAASATEALRAFERCSYELVLVDTDLGRYEGTELLPGLRSLPGIEEVPLVLVDGRPRAERRELARRLGAAGYLARPLDVPRIEGGLARLVGAPRRRRFTRYPQQLAVRPAGAARAEIAAQIGRGGMRLLTERDLPLRATERYVIALPHGAGHVRAEGEVVYRMRGNGPERSAVGVRFHTFEATDEERLIAWLGSLRGAGD